MTNLLTNPRSFFEGISSSEPCLKIPALIVLVIAVIGAINGYIMGELSGKMLSGLMEGIQMITAVSTAVISFIAIFVIWLIAALILFGLQKIMQGTGTFRKVFEICGYGMIPLVFASIITIIFMGYYLPQADITPIQTSNPEEISKAAMSLMEDPALHELSIISNIITILFLIWVANLWALGVERCCTLSGKKSLVVAGLPVVLYIAYILSTLLLFTGVPE